mgnify:CR=1 FL=1
MPHFIPDATYARLLDDLAGAFMTAAASTGADLRDTLAEALAGANLLPEVCRGDFEGEGVQEVV